MKHGPRFTAIETLRLWEQSGAAANQVMEKQLSSGGTADPRDRQLMAALVYGVIRWRGYLDWLISKFSSHPTKKMKTRTRQALRVGLYQLIFMDRIPDSAAINETVEALKKSGQPRWLLSFVNGLLRNVARSPDTGLPEKAGNEIPAPARLSHPEWLINRWQDRYGPRQTEEICETNNRLPPLCLRVNTRAVSVNDFITEIQAAGIAASVGIFAPEAVLLDYQGLIPDIPGYAEGFFQVQDQAAQLVSLLLSPLQNDKTYLDACAGLGGKTSHIAQMLAKGGRLTAVEPNRIRVKRLKENLSRLGLDALVAIIQDKLENLGTRKKFSGVLVDAPCSGLGVIRRQVDIRWNRAESDLKRYQERQLILLASAAELVEPGGVLVYATCSTEPEENDAVIKKFLAGHPEFMLSNCRDHLPAAAAELVDGEGFFRTVPGQHDLDGFFAARLRKC